MKKTIAVVLVLFAVLSLWAGVEGIVSLKPYYTGTNLPSSSFHYDGSRYTWDTVPGDEDTWNDLDGAWWMTRQDYWQTAYRKTSLLDLGLDARMGGWGLVTRFDIAQDFLANLTDTAACSTNIPFIGGLIDLSFPRLGYIDYESKDGIFYTSVGRRLIKWGPGTYDIAVGNSQPYLDNIWAELNTDMGDSWNFTYNWIGVFPKLWMNYNANLEHPDKDVHKTIFGHRWSFYSDYLRISIAELNNIYGKDPSFFDASPLIIWHDNNQDDYSNVFLHLSLEGKLWNGRVWGTFNMDDFDLPHEGHSSKPAAMGFSLGGEYHILDGKGIGNDKFDYRDYTLREDTYKIENGLNVGAEWYYTSPLIYNRNSDHNGAGKFTIPFQFISLTGDGYVYDEDAFFLGFKYGPNTSLYRVYAEYTSSPFEASLALEYITRGRYNINSSYGNRGTLDAMGLDNVLAMAGDKTRALLIDADFAYYLDDSFKVNAGLDLQYDITHNKSAYLINIGFSMNPLDVDWSHLF